MKREIVGVIKTVDNMECQTLLEKRYLCFETWEQIAVDMDYTVRNIYNLHSLALQKIKMPGRLQ